MITIFAMLPALIIPAAAETAFSNVVAGSSPSITYTLTYEKSRPSNTQMKYDFTLTARMSSGGYLLTGALNGKVTVNGTSKNVTIKARDTSWYQSSTPTKTFTFSITCSSTTGNASQSGNFTVTSPDFSSSGLINRNFTVTSSPLLTWTVSYNVNGGNNVSPSSATVNRGSSVTTPTPTKPSYTLTYNANGGTVSPANSVKTFSCNGWYTAASGGTKRANAGASYTPTQSETIYAQWSANPSMGTLPTPTRPGYYFLGWFTAASGGTQVTSSTIMTGNQTIYAQWTDIPFTIQTLDGEIIDNSKINYRLRLSVQQGAPLVVEAGFNVYVWNGVDFSTLYLTRYWTNEAGIGGSDWSWSLNDALPSNFFVVKAYAKNAAGVKKESENQWGWFQIVAEEYPVTYNANGGSPAPSAQAKYKDVPLTLRPEKPSRTGYSFAYWRASNGATYSPGTDYHANEATTLSAQWTPNNYTVKFNANGGFGSISDQPVNYDQSVTMPGDGAFIRDGYALTGWSRSPGTPNNKNYEKNATYAVSTLASASNYNCADANGATMTLYAVWTEDTYTITVPNDGNGTAYANLSRAKAGTVIVLTAIPKSGYSFKEWQVLSGGVTIIDNTFIMPAQDVTVWAIFDLLPPSTYAINVQNDGYGSANANLASATMGTEVTLTAIPNSGYRFKEWQIISGGISITNDKFTMPAQDVSIKAIFEPIIYAITVQNDGHGAAGSSPTSAVIGTEITLTSTPNNGYRFKEWQTISGGVTLANANSASITFFMPANAVTVKAIFEAEEISTPTHTVTYDYSSNGGSSATKLTDTVEEGQSINLTPTATKTGAGWEFVGWNTSKDATSAWEQTMPLLMGSSDVTLYAIYVKVVSASFIDYSPPGEISHSVSSMYRIYNNATFANVSAGAVPISNYPGWASRGWGTNTAANASVALADKGSTTISMDTSFYALYQRTLTLSFNADGGSSTPASQTGTQYTNAYAIDSPTSVSFTLPAAISKPGHKFVAWAEGSTDGKQYQPSETITISENTTIYALWSAEFMPYSFDNKGSNFAATPGGKHYMTNADFARLVGYAPAYEKLLIDLRDGESSGSCFGMAVTSILDYRNQIGIKELNTPEPAKTLDEVVLNDNVKSAINYYQIAEYISFLHPDSHEAWNMYNPLNWHNWETADLVEQAKIGPILASYLYKPEWAHAVVITGYESATNSFIVYDNREPSNNNVRLKVVDNANGTKTITLTNSKGTDQIVDIQFWWGADFLLFDKIQYNDSSIHANTALHDQSLALSATSGEQNITTISIVTSGVVTVSNAAGESFIYNTEEGRIVSGNMDVYSRYLISNSTTDGSSAPGTIVFTVPESESYSFYGTEKLSAKVVSNEFFGSIESPAPGVVAVLDKENGISVEGNGQFSYTAAIGVNNDTMDLVKVSGTAVGDMGLMLYGTEGAVISGSANQILDVTVISDLTQTERCSFKSNYDSLLVSKQEGELGVYGGAGYSDNILKPKTVTKPVANGSTSVTLDYVGSKQLSVTGESITWSGGNQYVSVDQTGKITSTKNFIKTGSAAITASNSAGSVTFNVKVKPTFWQWLMIIFLFGWIWM